MQTGVQTLGSPPRFSPLADSEPWSDVGSLWRLVSPSWSRRSECVLCEVLWRIRCVNTGCRFRAAPAVREWPWAPCYHLDVSALWDWCFECRCVNCQFYTRAFPRAPGGRMYGGTQFRAVTVWAPNECSGITAKVTVRQRSEMCLFWWSFSFMNWNVIDNSLDLWSEVAKILPQVSDEAFLSLSLCVVPPFRGWRVALLLRRCS